MKQVFYAAFENGDIILENIQGSGGRYKMPCIFQKKIDAELQHEDVRKVIITLSKGGSSNG